MSIIEDITDRRKSEEALRELNATLESRVAERTAALEYRAKQLQKLTLDLTEAEERERRRIAVILHEDLQQQIAGAKFHLNLVRNQSKDDSVRKQVSPFSPNGPEEVDATSPHQVSTPLSSGRPAPAPGLLHNRTTCPRPCPGGR